MISKVFGVVLAGGSGTRLWPLSRRLLPKQFLRLGNEESLFEKTVARIAPVTGRGNIVAVTNEQHAFGSGYHQLDKLHVLIEPCGRNTAPAIGLACLYLQKLSGADPVAVVLPSDHMITDREAFLRTIAAAVKEAEKGSIVTLGIKPSSPDTGYGYIKARGGKKGKALPVEKFVEKPDHATAARYLEEGGYYWNAGMFVFKVSVMMEEFRKYLPEAYALLMKIGERAFAGPEPDLKALSRLFPAMPSISIDYAVMEKSRKVCVIPSDFGWSDVGSWRYFYDSLPKDPKGNVKFGDVLALDSSDNLLYSGGRLVTAIGVKNLAVIETPDAILVSDIDRSQDVKNAVEELKKTNRCELEEHVTVERPWGSYTVLEDLPNYKVKRLKIMPGQKISYQYHRRRCEHWFVVSGRAEILLNGKKKNLAANGHIDIPAGARHMLYNPGGAPLEIIEVQSGDYFGEDDIIRIKDSYGRRSGDRKSVRAGRG